MKVKKNFGLSVFCFLSIAHFVMAESVFLFLSPTVTDEPFMTLEKDHPLLARASAVPVEEQASAGWQWLEVNGKYRGYVKSSEIGKALQVKPNSTIYSSADASSTVMTTVVEGDSVELTEITDDWAGVIFEKQIPLYLNPSLATAQKTPVEEIVASELSSSAMTASSTQFPNPTTIVVVKPAVVKSDTVEETAPAIVESESEVVEQPMEEIEEMEELPEREIVVEESPPVESIQSPTTTVGTPTESKESKDFFGILKPHSGNIFRPSKYSYKLVDQSGKKIALVDFGKVVLSQPLSSYLHQPIRVRGTFFRPDQKTGLVIVARNIYQMRQ